MSLKYYNGVYFLASNPYGIWKLNGKDLTPHYDMFDVTATSVTVSGTLSSDQARPRLNIKPISMT